MISFADIFAGCGGMSHGFYKNRSFRGVLAVDASEAYGKVYQSNLQGIPFEYRDLNISSEAEALANRLKGRCDVLLGGPPCQGFSSLGKRRDQDQRSKLVDTFVKLAVVIRPKVIIMENVRGIQSMRHRSGLTYPEFISDYLQNNGNYDVETLVLDAYDYGLAQRRPRFFAFAVKAPLNKRMDCLTKIMDFIAGYKTESRPTLKEAIGDLPYLESGEGNEDSTFLYRGKRRKIYNHRAMKHSPRLIARFSHVPIGGGLLDVPRSLLTDHLKRMIDGAYGSGGHIKNIYGRLSWNKPSGTVVAGLDKITCGRFVHPEAHRLLTPRECARLQSFPDSFRFQGSSVAQYYMIGNAVPPKISCILAKAIQFGLGGQN